MITLRDICEGLSLAENRGDISDEIKNLCELMGEPEPEWDNVKNRYVFSWEKPDNE